MKLALIVAAIVCFVLLALVGATWISSDADLLRPFALLGAGLALRTAADLVP